MPSVVGNLVERHVEVVVQHHHRAMIDGEPPEAALELVAIDDRARAIRLHRLIGGKQSHVRRPVVASATLGVAGAHEEPIRPGVEARRIAELGEVTPDGEQRLLRRVLGEFDVAQDPVRHRMEPVAHGDGEAREGLFVAVLCACHEIGIHASSVRAGINSGRPFTRYGRTGRGQDSIFTRPARRRLYRPMEMWQAINSIRVVRDFSERPIDPDHVDRILNAGRRTASSKNRQDWAFIVVRDREELRQLARVGPYADHLARAPTAIALVRPDATNEHQLRTYLWDLGRAAQNMVLAAWELGIGSVPATVYDLELASRLLGLPDDQRCDFLLSFGYPSDPSVFTAPNRAGGRRPLGEVVHEDTW